MEHEQVSDQMARRSAAVYLPAYIGVAEPFLILAGLSGDYSAVARIGGAAWVGLLSLIVTMPLVTSRVKKRMRDESSARH